MFSALFATIVSSLRTRAALQFEILALRHQLSVLQGSVKRPTLTTADRLWLPETRSDVADDEDQLKSEIRSQSRRRQSSDVG